MGLPDVQPSILGEQSIDPLKKQYQAPFPMDGLSYPIHGLYLGGQTVERSHPGGDNDQDLDRLRTDEKAGFHLPSIHLPSLEE